MPILPSRLRKLVKNVNYSSPPSSLEEQWPNGPNWRNMAHSIRIMISSLVIMKCVCACIVRPNHYNCSLFTTTIAANALRLLSRPRARCQYIGLIGQAEIMTIHFTMLDSKGTSSAPAFGHEGTLSSITLSNRKHHWIVRLDEVPLEIARMSILMDMSDRGYNLRSIHSLEKMFRFLIPYSNRILVVPNRYLSLSDGWQVVKRLGNAWSLPILGPWITALLISVYTVC